MPPLTEKRTAPFDQVLWILGVRQRIARDQRDLALRFGRTEHARDRVAQLRLPNRLQQVGRDAEHLAARGIPSMPGRRQHHDRRRRKPRGLPDALDHEVRLDRLRVELGQPARAAPRIRDGGQPVRVLDLRGDSAYASRHVPSAEPADFATLDTLAKQRDETLVLITCGGDFNRQVRRYTDNIVIYAVPVIEPSATS